MKLMFRYNLLSYIFLFFSIILIFISFFYKNSNSFQYEIIFITVILYLISSIAHHHFDKSLTFEVGLEYILIGGLAALVIFGTII